MPDQKFILSIRVHIYPENGMGSGLEVSENVSIKAIGFMELCKILSAFHDLGQKIKEEKERS